MFKVSPEYFNVIWVALLIACFLSGCSQTSELYRLDSSNEQSNIDYSIIYYIHADSDYLYHDTNGEPVWDNSQVLGTALNVAEKAESGELFIFYQRHEKTLLGLFPRRNSQLYHFTNGQLQTRINYRHTDKKEPFLTTEARLFHQLQLHSGSKDHRIYFLFFGHEIPDDEGKSYHQSLPDIEVNIASFAEGVQNFLPATKQTFSLIALSTCNNGTPQMAKYLMPITQVMLASPQNLHLSHIDSKYLNAIEINPEISSVQLAHTIANQTYQRLESETETAITLAVYDFENVKDYISDLHAIISTYNASGNKQPFSDNIDCGEIENFDNHAFQNGITIWHRLARFGRKSPDKVHSGWGCKPPVHN
jgi:hypothetical protein